LVVVALILMVVGEERKEDALAVARLGGVPGVKGKDRVNGPGVFGVELRGGGRF